MEAVCDMRQPDALGKENISCICLDLLLRAAEKGQKEIEISLCDSAFCDYPEETVLPVLINVCRIFLQQHDMEIAICTENRDLCRVDDALLHELDRFENIPADAERNSRSSRIFGRKEKRADSMPNGGAKVCASVDTAAYAKPEDGAEDNLEDIIIRMDETFAVKLMKLIDLKGMTDVECYKKANVSRQTWFKILNDGSYRPSKKTILAFAIALELTFDETQALLGSAGFTLSGSIKFDVIITYFIKNGKYDIFEIEEALFRLDQPSLSAG